MVGTALVVVLVVLVVLVGVGWLLRLGMCGGCGVGWMGWWFGCRPIRGWWWLVGWGGVRLGR